MNTIFPNENNIEQFLKKQASFVEPSRDLFESTIKDVTKQESHRNTKQRANVLSPYQLTSYFFMKKIAYIGVPLVVVALAVAVTVKNPSSPDTKMAYQESSSQVETASNSNSNNTTNTQNGNNPSSAASNANASIDDIVDGLIADAASDVSTSDSNEEASLETELQDYNNLKTTDYENSI